MGEDAGWRRSLGGYVYFNNGGDVVSVVLMYKQKEIRNCTIENWRGLGDAVLRSPALEKIELCGCHLSADALAAVFGSEREHRRPLKEFVIADNYLGPAGMDAVLPFLRSTPAIGGLHLEHAELGDAGAILVSELSNRVRIEHLDLQWNEIGDEGVERLLSSESSSQWRSLEIRNNPIGVRGFGVISQFLQRDDTKMQEFYFDCTEKDQIQALVGSISRRSELVKLFSEERGDRYEDDDTLDGYLDGESLETVSVTLRNLVCDARSLRSLCESNHRLAWTWVGTDTERMLDSDPVLRKAMKINAQSMLGASIVTRCRSKLRAFYLEGHFDVQPFVGMHVVYMPFVLELATRKKRLLSKGDESSNGIPSDVFGDEAGRDVVAISEGDLGSVYRLVRNCHLPELFGFPSPESRIRGEYDGRISSLEDKISTLAAQIERLCSESPRSSKKRAKSEQL